MYKRTQISHCLKREIRRETKYSETMQVSHFSSYFLPLILASINDTCLQQLLQLLLCCLPNCHFSISTIPSTFTVWNFILYFDSFVLLTCPYNFLTTSLLFATTKCFRPICSFPVFTQEFLTKD